MSPLHFARSHVQGIYRSLKRHELESLNHWGEHGCSINEDLRARRIGSFDRQILDAVDAASRVICPGQILWRGSAYADSVHLPTWIDQAYSCCSTSREVGERFVDDPGWPWPEMPEDITLGGLPARPRLAKIVTGTKLRAAPVAQLIALALEREDEMSWYCRFDSRLLIEHEVTLLPCRFTVIEASDHDFTLRADGLSRAELAQLEASPGTLARAG
jgi:hypothetical protein